MRATATPGNPRGCLRPLSSCSIGTPPGNVRELVSVLQVALALAGNGPVGLEHLPAGFLAESQVPVPVATEEADLHALVAQANGNLSAVARRLGISRTTLYKRLRER